ncbi:MAG: thiol-disulfide isomerase-like protein [Pseudomonadota bacterium]
MAFFFISFMLTSMQGLLKFFSKTVKQIMLLGMLFTLLLSQAHAIEVGDYLPLGQIQSIQGETFTPEYWAKRNTIVQVWATWCSYCRTQNKYIQQLRQKIPADQLNIVTISIDRRVEPVKDYIERNQYTFPVVMMTPELAKAIGKRRGVPELYVVNPQGRVIQKDFGLMVDLDLMDLARYAKK